MATRPTDYGYWAMSDSTNGVSGENNVVTPDAAYQSYGWQEVNEHPTRQQVNWIGRRNGEWNEYLDENQTDMSNTLYPGLSANLGATSVYEGLLAVDPQRLDGFRLEKTAIYTTRVGAGTALFYDASSVRDEIFPYYSSMRKLLNSTWTAGDGGGGRAAGVSLTNYTWYHVHALTDGTTMDFAYDTDVSASNAVADTGYRYHRRVGSVYYFGAGNGIVDYTHSPETSYVEYGYPLPLAQITEESVGYAYQQVNTESMTPPDVRTILKIMAVAENSGEPGVLRVMPTTANVLSSRVTAFADGTGNYGTIIDDFLVQPDQTSAISVATRSIHGGALALDSTVTVIALGYYDPRKIY